MKRLAYVLALGAAAPGFAQASSQPIYGVARAGDGDSLEISGQRVRLFGIDAPEFDQTCTKGGAQWACGAEAADQLSRLVPEGGQDGYRTGEMMTKRTRRNHSPAFKARVALAAVKGGAAQGSGDA